MSKKALLRIREGPERLLTGPERLLTGPWPVRQEVIRHLVEPELPHEVPSSVGLTSGSVSIRPNPARTMTTNFLH